VERSTNQVTHLLKRSVEDETARDELFNLIYDDLHAAAQRVLRKGIRGDMQTTALVNESMLRFQDSTVLGKYSENRRVFFSVAIRAMQQVLLNHHRKRRREKSLKVDAVHPFSQAISRIEEVFAVDFESLYQERYWHQVTNRVVEPLYAAEDPFVSLGVDQVVVEQDQRVPIRVRIRDGEGRPRTSAQATAYLTNAQGERVAQVALTPDASEGGRFTAEVAADLPPGVYEVGVSVEGVSEADLLAKTLITVRGGDVAVGELADLTANLDLLGQVASSTGGRVLREHQADELVQLLDGLSFSTEEQTVSKLWQGWPWFSAVVVLLGAELLLRRRMGMI